MLPFPKRKTASDVVELTDDDLVIVASETPQARPVERHARGGLVAEFGQRPPRKRTAPPGSRRVLDESVEVDVADQCLASIAAETSRDATFDAASEIRAAIARPATLAPPSSSSFPVAMPSAPASMSRLPSISAPPFVRGASMPPAASAGPFRAEAPGLRDSAPPPAFVRRSSPLIPVAVPSSYAALTRSTPDQPSERNAASVAPVSLSQRPVEPTVIVVRERPRAAWILAAAALGALGAIVGSRLLAHPGDERAPSVAAAQLPAPPSPIAASTVPASAAAPSAVASAAVPTARAAVASAAAPASADPVAAGGVPANVIRFGADQGVAIKVPAPAAAPTPRPPAKHAAVKRAARPASRSSAGSAPPAAGRLGPALPDGSFSLADESAPAAKTTPARGRALTPEQILAEAQLKASMQ